MHSPDTVLCARSTALVSDRPSGWDGPSGTYILEVRNIETKLLDDNKKGELVKCAREESSEVISKVRRTKRPPYGKRNCVLVHELLLKKGNIEKTAQNLGANSLIPNHDVVYCLGYAPAAI